MKILHISNYYYPHIGGIEQVAKDCVDALKEEHEQRVICFNHERGDDVSEVEQIPVIRVGCFAEIASQSLSLHYKKLLKRQFQEFRPDTVIFHYPNPFVAHFLLPLLKKYPCKFIVWWHLDITKQKLLGKLFKGQSRKLLRRAESVVATSPNYIDGSEFLSRVREKCRVIPCCANPERTQLGETEQTEAEIIRNRYSDKIILFTVGRHVPYKGLEYLIRASALLDERFVIFIGGLGPLTNELKKQASADNKIVFLGKLSNEQLKVYLSACDIYCFPSITKNEAFGIALAEAMSFGKPSVTFTIPGSGVNYVSLNGITGIEAKNADVAAYADGIRVLAENKELRRQYGNAAKQRAERLFSKDIFFENVRKMISEL